MNRPLARAGWLLALQPSHRIRASGTARMTTPEPDKSLKPKQAMRASACEAKRRRSSSSHSRVAKKLSHMALS